MSETSTLPDLVDGSPAGSNLELDPVFGEMERAAQGKAETQYGNTVEPAVPPDWKETAVLAAALLERTRDLRVMAQLATARLHLEGLGGFAETLADIHWYLDHRWDSVHPQLDPEDDNDPMQRTNALAMLADPGRVLRPLRDLPLAGTPRTGSVTWRDIAIMNGVLEGEPGRPKLTETTVRAAFAGTDGSRLTTLGAAADSVTASLVAIAAAFDGHAQPGSGPDFEEVIKVLRDIGKTVRRYEAIAAEAAEPEAAVEPEAGEEPGAEPERIVRVAPRIATIQSIAVLNSRDDALHALELAAAYFRANEPSSPLPLLIDRAKRLAPLPFLDILRDLAPDGLLQAQTIAGTIQEEPR